jgi:hypothetical protein
MVCSKCNNCNGEKSTTIKSLDFETSFRGSDCEVDNNPCWQDVEIESNRGKDAHLKITIQPDNGQLNIKGQTTIKIKIPKHGERQVSFEIAKNNGSTQKEELLEIEIEMERTLTNNWVDLSSLNPVRKIKQSSP